MTNRSDPTPLPQRLAMRALPWLAVLAGLGCEFIPDKDPDLPQVGPGHGLEDVCGEFPLETGTKVLFVLDKSGTMFADELAWDHDADPDTADVLRWKSLYSVVQFVVDGFDDSLSLGALLFPGADSGCKVGRSPEIPVAVGNGSTLLAHLPGPDAYFDEYHLTPLPTALENAVQYMLGFDEDDAKAIILVSDGVPSPSCEGTFSTAAQTARQAWLEHGIPTYVVGIAIEEEYAQEFALLAAAGGKPDPETSFYDTQDELQLLDALEEIAISIPDCRINLEEVPTYPDMLDIHLGGQTLEEVDDCQTENGWRYVDETHGAIEVCGAACEMLKAGENDMSASYGCPDPVEPDLGE